MTIIVSVKINDGIVMAADSISSFPGLPVSYQHANKIANLRKGLPIGVMVTGNGGIGNESAETLFKDLRRRFAGDSAKHADWRLDPNAYTLENVAARVREFLFEEKTESGRIEVCMQMRICGYSANRPLSQVWEVALRGKECPPPSRVQDEEEFGVRWDGEYEALDRLILGTGAKFASSLSTCGLSEEQSARAKQQIGAELYESLGLPAMPIQDAIDLARYLVETTIGFVKFSVNREKTVGGPVEIAAITKHEGFRWVQRKHFFPFELNRP
jgi:20S proteasome alpha/beta subunit